MTERTPRRPSQLPALVARTSALLGVALLAVVSLSACGKKCQPCVDKSKPELDKCSMRAEGLQKEVNTLKRQLAQALADPGSIKVDPSVLTIDGKPIKVAKGTAGGTLCKLNEKQVVSTIAKSKGSLQPCYQRALKRDSSLHHRKIVLTLSLKVRASGAPTDISIKPTYNSTMNDCMRKAIRRWRFPAASAGICGVESPMTFTPKR